MRYLSQTLIIIITISLLSGCKQPEKQSKETLSLFPLANYSQNLSEWINPSDPNYDKPLVAYGVQLQRTLLLYQHFFGEFSPWNPDYVSKIIQHKNPDDIKTIERGVIYLYNNKDKTDHEIGYGENFRPHTESWINDIANNINVEQFSNLSFQPNRRAIAIDNLYARALPTDDVHFYSYQLPGQGYPFDNLQMSALWAGTPVYILGETLDHAWSLVITPEYIAWVKTNGLARTNEIFVATWQAAAKAHLVAITHTKTPIVDTNGVFRFSAYVGSIFPVVEAAPHFKIMIPISDSNRNAVINYSTIPTELAALIPLSATPHHFSNVMSTLIGRPYGWGNLYFYNDCSSEIKSLMTPFGFWLPRNSSEQANAGKLVDLSSENETERLNYLLQNGHPFLSTIYVGKHIILYVGKYANTYNKNPAEMALTYQNMWGLSPFPPTRRAVIGQSVLFPLLTVFPEDPTLNSQANKKTFQVTFLDETPNNLLKLEIIDLKMMMTP